MSEPTLIGTWCVAQRTRSVRRGSFTIRVAPFLTARFT